MLSIFWNQNIYMLIITNEFVHVYYDTKLGFMLLSLTYIVILKKSKYRNNIYIFRFIMNSLSIFMIPLLVSYILYHNWLRIYLNITLISYITNIGNVIYIFWIQNIPMLRIINEFVHVSNDTKFGFIISCWLIVSTQTL